jgi:hypothetical protein
MVGPHRHDRNIVRESPHKQDECANSLPDIRATISRAEDRVRRFFERYEKENRIAARSRK